MLAALEAQADSEKPHVVWSEGYIYKSIAHAIDDARARRIEIPQKTLFNDKRGLTSQATHIAIESRKSIETIPREFEGAESDSGLIEDLYRFLDGLPNDQRQIVQHSYGLDAFDEMKDADIATRFEVCSRTIARKR